MKKIKLTIIIAILAIVLIWNFTSNAATEVTVTVNGNAVFFPDAQPIIDGNDRTMIPVRFVTETLGCTVNWIDNGTNGRFIEIIRNTPYTRILLEIDKNFAIVNKEGTDKKILFDTTTKIINERTNVPIRFISETLNYFVDWDGHSRTVIIDTKKQIPSPTPTPKVSYTVSTNEKVEESYTLKNEIELMSDLSRLLLIDGLRSVNYDIVGNGYYFGYEEYNPNENWVTGTLGVDIINSISVHSAYTIRTNTETNLKRFKKSLDILAPEIADEIYNKSLNYMGGSTEKYFGTLSNGKGIYIKGNITPGFKLETNGCLVRIFNIGL